MKKLLCLLFILFFCQQVEAKAFLVCDPAPGVTSYILTDNGKLVGQVAAKKDGSLRYNVSRLHAGFHGFTITSCSQYECGVQVARFNFIRPNNIQFLNPPPRKGESKINVKLEELE